MKLDFTMLGHFVTRHPRKIVAVALILSILSIFLALTRIHIDADQDNLVSSQLDYHRHYKDFLSEFGDQEYLYIVVETDQNPSRAKLFLYRLWERLKDKKEIKKITYKIDNPLLEQSFLLYLSKGDLDSLRSTLGEEPFTPRKLMSLRSMEDLFREINQRLDRPINPKDEEKWTTGFKFLNRLVTGQTAVLKEGKEYSPFLEGVFFGEDNNFDEDGYLITKDRKFLVALVMPEKDYSTMAVIDKPLKLIRSALDDTRKEFPDIKAGLTGRPVLAADEMNTTSIDMTRATILAIIIVGILFVLLFRGIERPLLALASLLVGISLSFGLLALTFGRLNLLSVVFVTILIGATIEYAIHIVARYQEELVQGYDPKRAIQNTLVLVGPANLASALTTACAFAAISWSKFVALGELGFIAGTGVLLCLASMLILLPALLIVADGRSKKFCIKRLPSLACLVALQRHPRTIIAVAVFVTTVSAVLLPQISFDDNLLNLQAKGLESVIYEKKMIDESDESSWFAISIAKDIDEANYLAEKFSSLPSVKKVEDIGRVLPLNQNEKMIRIRELRPLFRELNFVSPLDSVDPVGLKRELNSFKLKLGRLQEEAFSGGRIDAVEELDRFIAEVDSLVNEIDAVPNSSELLSKYQVRFFNDLQKKIAILASGFNPKKIELKDLPKDVTEKYISPNGRFAVYVTPLENIWEPSRLEKFIKEVRTVDPNVTGVPVEVFESGKLMRRTFLISAGLAYIMIMVIALVHFRAVKEAILSMLPLTIGLVWLVGAMVIAGIDFNMANFFGIPILMGIGIDAGIHLIHRLKREGSILALGRSMGQGIFLTGLSNAVGFGAMMIANHRGIKSLGQIMGLGSILVMFAALIAVPAITGRALRVTEIRH